MRSPAKIRDAVLESLLELGSKQLEESHKSIEEIKSILPLAKNPRDRTALNIIFDDEKKVVKALDRLISDLAQAVEEKEF